MVPALLIGGGLAAGGLASQIFGKDNRAADAYERAMQAFNGIEPPTPEELSVELQKMVYQGDITPEEAQTVLQGHSEMQNIATGPEGKQAQLKALSGLQGIVEGGGMNAQDKATLNEIQNQQSQAERGNREAILMNAQERGVGGSGAELASQMLNQQASATRGNQAGLDVAGQAQARALQALQQYGQMGGQYEGQQFGQEASKAQAQDLINQFNARNRQDVVNTNVAARNAAAARNVETKQGLSNQNTDIANQQAHANALAKQQAFQNKVTLAGGKAGNLQAMGDLQQKQADAREKMNAGLISTGGSIFAQGARTSQTPQTPQPAKNPFKNPMDNTHSDKRLKKNIHEVSEPDLEEFLASIDPKAFEFKDPSLANGQNVGVMAQDLEKSKVGRTMVEDTPSGKILDMHKGFGVILAALAALHDKIEKEKGGDSGAEHV